MKSSFPLYFRIELPYSTWTHFSNAIRVKSIENFYHGLVEFSLVLIHHTFVMRYRVN